MSMECEHMSRGVSVTYGNMDSCVSVVCGHVSVFCGCGHVPTCMSVVCGYMSVCVHGMWTMPVCVSVCFLMSLMSVFLLGRLARPRAGRKEGVSPMGNPCSKHRTSGADGGGQAEAKWGPTPGLLSCPQGDPLGPPVHSSLFLFVYLHLFCTPELLVPCEKPTCDRAL